MSFTRVAGSTHEPRICNHLVPEEECREASRKQTARSGSHVRPVSCDRAGDARWVAPCPAAVALPDVLRPGLEVTGVSRGPMSFSYGLSAEEAAPYLTLPKGKKLAGDGTELALVNL